MPKKTVKHGKSTSELSLAETGLLRLSRKMNIVSPRSEIDGYPAFWMLAVAHTIPKQLAVRFEGETTPMVGSQMIFVPGFSLIEWQLGPGRLCFDALIGAYTDNVTYPKTPSMRQLDRDTNPLADKSWREMLAAPRWVPVATKTAPPAVRRAKLLIDQSFRDQMSIADIAAVAKVNPSTLSTQFRKWYGITPVAYRNRLRVFHSKFQLLASDDSVSQIGLSAGFDDLSHFNQQFRHLMAGVPSDFRLPT